MICSKCNKNSLFIMSSGSKKTTCRECGHIIDFLQPSYKNYHLDRYENKPIRTRGKDPLLGEIFNNLNFRDTDTVLDYGCGLGDYSFEISKIAKTVIGVDTNIKSRRKKFGNISFQQQKGVRIKFNNGFFDKIICVNVIEHVHDYDKLLKEFKRILKQDGSLFITTFDRNFILRFFHNDLTHVIEWNQQEFTELISKYFNIKISFKHGTFFNYYPFNKIIVKFLKPEICIVACK